jgi:hypothetical protein
MLDKNASRVSWILFAFFSAIWSGLTIKFGYENHVVSVFRHAFEGGMVGCICDWYAVREVYKKAEEKYESLVNETASMIVTQMMQVKSKSIADTIFDELKDETRFESHLGLLDGVVSSHRQLDEKILGFWHAHGRDEFVRFLCAEDFSPRLKGYSQSPRYFMSSPESKKLVRSFFSTLTLTDDYIKRLKYVMFTGFYGVRLYDLLGFDGLQDVKIFVANFYEKNVEDDLVKKLVDMRFEFNKDSELLDNSSVRNAIADIVGRIGNDTSFNDTIVAKLKGLDVVKTSKISFVANAAIDKFIKPRELLERIEKGLRNKDDSQSAIWRDIIDDLVTKYIAVWNGLDRRERELAAAALITHFSPSFIELIAKELHEAYHEVMLHDLIDRHLTVELARTSITAVGELLTADEGVNKVADDKKIFINLMLILSDAWNAQPFPQKKKSMDEVANFVEAVFIKNITATLWSGYSERRQGAKSIYEMFGLGRFDGLVRELFPAGGVDDLTADFIRKKLLNMEEVSSDGSVMRGKPAFVAMLKRNTKPRLDMIQFNGTVLGLVLGGLVGLVSLVATVIKALV